MYLHEIKSTLYILSMTFNDLVQKNCLLYVLNQKNPYFGKSGMDFVYFSIFLGSEFLNKRYKDNFFSPRI